MLGSMSQGAGSGPTFREGKLVTQGPVMGQVDILPGLAEQRYRAAHDANIPEHRIMGREVATKDGSRQYGLLDHIVCDWALIEVPRDVIGTSSGDIKAHLPIACASLNGWALPGDVKTQAQLEKRWMVFGAFVRNYRYPGDNSGSGAATMVRGSKTCYFRGKKGDQLRPGDLAAWRLRSMDPKICKLEGLELANSDEHPADRLDVVIEPLTYTRTHQFLQRELTMSFSRQMRGRYTPSMLRGEGADIISDDARAVMALRTFTMLAAVNGIIVDSLYRGVEIPVPGNGVRSALTPEMYQANLAAEKTQFHELIRAQGRVIEPSADKARLVVSPNKTVTPELISRRARIYEFLAAKLGLASSAANQFGDPAYEEIEAILGLTLQPLLMDPQLANGCQISRLFDEEARRKMKRPANFSSDRGLSQEWNPATVLGCLGHIQSSAAVNMFRTFGEATEEQHRHILFKSLSYSVAGQSGGSVDEMH